jgi:hypothetical protein
MTIAVSFCGMIPAYGVHGEGIDVSFWEQRSGTVGEGAYMSGTIKQRNYWSICEDVVIDMNL